MNETQGTQSFWPSFSSESFVIPEKTKKEEVKKSDTLSIEDQEKELVEEAILELEDAVDSFLKRVKLAEEQGKKEPDQFAFIDKIAPLLKTITKHSSKGIKIAAKAIDITEKTLPYEIPEKFNEIINKFTSGAKTYVNACKLISTAFYILELNSNKKLELLLENKKNCLRDLYTIRDTICPPNEKEKKLNLYQQKEINTLNQEIEKLEQEIDKLQTELKKRFDKWNAQIAPVAVSSLIACLKLIKPTCSTGLKGYLSFAINTLKIALDIHGIFNEGKKLVSSVKKLLDLRQKWFDLDAKISFYEEQLEKTKKEKSEKLETLETPIDSPNNNEIAYERIITILKAKKCFLERVEFPERWKNIGFKFLEFIKDATSFIGTVGALFVVTSVVAGFFTTFALWLTVISYLITAGSYVYGWWKSSSVKLTAEQIYRKEREDRLTKIFELRAKVKMYQLDENKKNELSSINETYMQKIQEYYDKYKIDLLKAETSTSKKEEPKNENSYFDNEPVTSIIMGNAVKEQKALFNDQLEDEKRNRFMKEIGLDEQKYEQWVNEVMEYMFEDAYIDILKKGLGIELSNSPDKALEQVINYIRV